MLATVGDVSFYAGVLCVAAALVAAFADGSAWQLPERVGTGLVLTLVSGYLLAWRYDFVAQIVPGQTAQFDMLASLLSVSAGIKALQVKRRRDWVFIYLLSFFQVLLATSASFTPVKSLLLLAYLSLGLASLLYLTNTGVRLSDAVEGRVRSKSRYARPSLAVVLPGVAVCLVVLIFALAVPIFLLIPRIERSARARVGNGATRSVGFSNRMALGQIGRLQQSDDLVMRVRLDDAGGNASVLRWRGGAFDRFDGRQWQLSDAPVRSAASRRQDLFDLGSARGTSKLVGQTVFLEPLDTQVLFAAPRAVAIEGALPYVLIDSEDGLTTKAHATERITYKAYSDLASPAVDELRADRRVYPADIVERYLQRPSLDPRVEQLASQIAHTAAPTRYDFAVAVEKYLREHFDYSLDMRARGDDPLADFLFNVRSGHCEYFASAMAMLLRTRGVAARVVNGFQAGRYNSRADAYIVRQRDAHAWVEVYFPGSDAWVAFDPTPPAEHPGNTAEASSAFDEYAEAVELFWTQYVASYGRQEQRSLVAGLRTAVDGAVASASQAVGAARGWWLKAKPSATAAGVGRGSNRIKTFLLVALIASVVCAAAIAVARLRRRSVRGEIASDGANADASPAFYRRMLELLAGRKRRRATHETPQEFAASIDLPEVRAVTDAYHRVRYGGETLTAAERERIEAGLRLLEERQETGVGR